MAVAMKPFAALYALLDRSGRRQLVLTVAMMALTALVEMATIGAAMPFLAILSGSRSGLITATVARAGVMTRLGADPLQIIATVLGLIVVATALMRLLMTWLTQRFVAEIGHRLTMRIWRGILHQSFDTYLERNSSSVLGGMEKVRPAVTNVVQPAMQGLGAAIVAVLLGLFVFAIARWATAIIVCSAIGVYAVSSVLTRHRLGRNSSMVAASITTRNKLVQEGLGSFRDITLTRSQPVFEQRLQAIDLDQQRATASNALIAAAPRFLTEAAAIIAIVMVAVVASRQPGGLMAAIPTLGALALGGQRVLPLLQQVYTSWTQVRGNIAVLDDVVALAGGAEPAQPVRAPRESIHGATVRFSGVAFAYRGGRPVLHDVDLTIRRGERIGLVGASGSGKSTLLDLLTGLLAPTKGVISVDGVPVDDANRTAWQAHLAYVPQAIYLLDASIAENIAFAINPAEVDLDRLQRAVSAAHLEALVTALPAGLATVVGERGVRLSGGQRQRIGIARALYCGPSLLILDEATSALDEASEAAILATIADQSPELTILIVAHRASSLALCQRILQLQDGKVIDHGGADPALPKSSGFPDGESPG